MKTEILELIKERRKQEQKGEIDNDIKTIIKIRKEKQLSGECK